MGRSYDEQLAAKQHDAERALGSSPGVIAGMTWLPPVASRESGFRNKAKMVVGGTVARPTIGILDADGRGIDLRECGLYPPGIRDVLPLLAEFVTRAALTPYDVPGPWPFRRPFFLLLNLAVGGDWPGQETEDPALPAELLVDWIRVDTLEQ